LLLDGLDGLSGQGLGQGLRLDGLDQGLSLNGLDQLLLLLNLSCCGEIS